MIPDAVPALLAQADGHQTVVMDLWDLLVAGLLVAVGVGAAALQRAGLTGEFLLGGVRTVAQLTAVGFVLQWLFDLAGWASAAAVVAGLGVMLLVASWEARRRSGLPGGADSLAIFLAAIGAGLAITVVIGVLLVIRPDDPLNPRYTLVVGGLITGNAMNGANLAAERLAGGLRDRRREVEAALCLGADGPTAAASVAREAFRAALIPTINTMMTIGLVALPGMMTGQITAGADPLQAVIYQVVIIYMLASCVPTAALVTVRLAVRRMFTADHQLRPETTS